jgi:hypothetical protein
MELDDLREKWKSAVVQPSSVGVQQAIEKRISAFETSGRGIRKVFLIELAVVATIYAGALLILLFVGERMVSYMYKIIVVTAIGSLPVIWRLYKSQKWINTMNYGDDMRSNIIAFLAYYKATLTLYKWTTYVVVLVIFILMFSDSEFTTLSLLLKIVIGCYMFGSMLLVGPYIRVTYGRKAGAFEDFLRE